MGEAIGATLGFAVGIAISPIPVAAAILMLFSDRARTNATAFGVGWGIAGFCPGGAVPALGIGFGPTAIFLIAMMAGIVAARMALHRSLRLNAA